MFRKTTISLTLVALTTVATMSAAPALAAPASEGSISSTEIGGTLIDFTDIVSATMDESPTETDDPADEPLCFVEDDESWTPCIDLGSLLGFPSVDEPETDEPLTPGGIVTDVPVDVVEPERDLIDPALIPDISDIIDFPGVSDTDDSEASEGDGLVRIVGRPDLAEALREAGIGTISDATDAADLAESDDLAPVTEFVPTPTEETTEVSASSDATSDAATAMTVAPERNTESGAADSTTTTVPIVEEVDDGQTVLAAIDLSTSADSDQGINPLLGALFGALAALVLAGAGFTAFKLGRRGA